MKAYPKLLQQKLDSIVSNIMKIELDLRCCGNCIDFVNGKCNKNKHRQYMTEQPFRYCVEWENDGLTNDERIIENI